MHFTGTKPILSSHSKRRPRIVFQEQLLLNAGQKYCRMLHGEHYTILLTFFKLAFVFKIFVLSIFEWPFKTGFTVFSFFNSTEPYRVKVRFCDHCMSTMCCLLSTIASKNIC